MRMKLLLAMLCGALSLPFFAQEHLATPRKEIRAKLKVVPQDNGLPQVATRASGE